MDYKARLYCNDTNSLTLNSGNFNCTTVSASSLRTSLIKNNVSGSSLTYKNFSDTTLLTIANDGSTTFVGEISTPSFNSINVDNTISTLQTDLNTVEGNITTLQTDLNTIEGNITTLQTDLNTVEGNITTLQTDLNTVEGNISTLQTSQEPHGFYQPTLSTFIIETGFMKFRISNASGNYSVYFKGKKYDVNAIYSVNLPPEGVTRFIWFTVINDVLTIQYGDNTGFNINEQILIAYVINFSQFIYVIGDERHGITMDRITHAYLHKTQGSKYVSGGLLSNYTLNSVLGTFYQVGATTFYDEDFLHSLPETNNFKLIYRTGSTGLFTIYDAGGTLRIITNPYGDLQGSGDIAYNQFDGSTWLVTSVTGNNNYVNYYLIATNTYINNVAQYFIIPAQAFYTTEAAAFAETIYDINFGYLPFAECVPLAKITYKHITNSTAAGSAQIIRVRTITDTNITISQSSPALHNNLADIQGGLSNELYHLSSTEYSKVQELSAYTITPPPTGGPFWPSIPIIKSPDGVMEIGRYLDFHHISANTGDYRARINCEGPNYLSLTSSGTTTGAFRTNYFLADQSVETNKITPRTLNGNLIINTYETVQRTIASFNNDLTTVFSGEISTPTWSSTDPIITNHNDFTDLQGWTSTERYHLTENEKNKIATLVYYDVPAGSNGTNWPAICVISDIGETEIGNTLDFHLVGQDGVNNSGRFQLVAANDVSFNGVFRCTGLRGYDTNSFTYKNNSGTTLMTIDNIGNVLISGTLTQNGGSNTITHLTQSTDATLEEGVFVETTGENYYEPDFVRTYKDENGESVTETIPKNPYENCICKVKRASSLNKNIVGVLTSVNPVKLATHGDVLIKVISDTYNLGDILIPTVDGYGKKATSGEIYDSLFMMIPRAKITALITDVPNTVSAILL